MKTEDLKVGQIVTTIGGIMNRRNLHAKVIAFTGTDVTVQFPKCYGFDNYSVSNYPVNELEPSSWTVSDFQLHDQYTLIDNVAGGDEISDCCVCCHEEQTELSKIRLNFFAGAKLDFYVCDKCLELFDDFSIKSVSTVIE